MLALNKVQQLYQKTRGLHPNKNLITLRSVNDDIELELTRPHLMVFLRTSVLNIVSDLRIRSTHLESMNRNRCVKDINKLPTYPSECGLVVDYDSIEL
ncbi:hypothetical protein NPIL_318741 [Nephila pilipes]|uniref:Uncharacterized protein n=1 Tax=Nephila pilipes TaxID=299642 RepID=A0A8X6TJT5_NEPPI|nr:hypothetical protein NPIL_318741 [Nephila pilipes]